jgi:hypothetical protein
MVRQANLNVPILAARMMSCHDCGLSIRGSKALYNHRKHVHKETGYEKFVKLTDDEHILDTIL